MRSLALFSAALLVALVSCKSHKPVPLDKSEAADLPQAAVLQKLREMLPTSEYVNCTGPKLTLKPTDITTWTVENDAIGIDYGRGNALRLPFAEVTDVRMEAVGKFFHVRVFTQIQPERDRPHFEFVFRIQERAKEVGELILAMKKR
jgi:hypothetical protein